MGSGSGACSAHQPKNPGGLSGGEGGGMVGCRTGLSNSRPETDSTSKSRKAWLMSRGSRMVPIES